MIISYMYEYGILINSDYIEFFLLLIFTIVVMTLGCSERSFCMDFAYAHCGVYRTWIVVNTCILFVERDYQKRPACCVGVSHHSVLYGAYDVFGVCQPSLSEIFNIIGRLSRWAVVALYDYRIDN